MRTATNRIRIPLDIFILTGGQSSRMGRDKSRLLLGARTFLDRITAAARALNLPVQTISDDDNPGLGPLGGIATALRGSFADASLFLSCDMPLVSPELLEELRGRYRNRAVFTDTGGKAGFPFILPRGAEPIVRLLLQRNDFSLQQLSAALNAELFLPLEPSRWQLENVNTPPDYARVSRIWTERRKSVAVLEVRHLTVRRGRAELVSDFSWQVRKGEHWAVLGANGCGKTSLFSSLLGYVTPTRGDIFVLGEEYGDADWPELRKKIGMVSSSVRQMMADTEPAWITVASGKYAMIDFWGTPRPRDKAEALQLLSRIECEHLAERPWAYLSQGERQRVLIARALMAHPALLILDEPCAGLDPAAREHFLNFLERLGRKPESPSIVLVTHHVEEVMPVFTHILLMKKGQKLAEGPVASMLTSSKLSETFDTRMQIRKQSGRYALRVTALREVIA